MAYIRKGNLPKADGTLQRWAAKLSTFVANEIVKKRTGNSMFVSELEDTDRWLLVLPRQTDQGLEVVVLYRPKLAASRLEEINAFYEADLPASLCELWDYYAHAFVHFLITPANLSRLKVVDHDATIRSTSEIDDIFKQQAVPTLEMFDQAISSNFAMKHADWVKPVSRAVELVSRTIPERTQAEAGRDA